MYETGANVDESVDYNLFFCHACLSSNRTLTPVGDLFDIYLKVCDNSLMSLTSQINVCWECLALLKKVNAFRRKVENAQKILDYCVNKQTPLEDSLSNLTLSNIETTSFDFSERLEDFEGYLDNAKTVPYSELDKDGRIEVRLAEEPYIEVDKERICDDSYNELMFKIEDVRGRCDILDVRPMLDLSTSPSEVNGKLEQLESPEDDAEQKYLRWKRSAMLVFKRICSHRYAQHFMRPVSDELAPHYSRVVRQPTDLSTVRGRIKDGAVRTTAELTRDLQLMFSNALMYNSSHHFIYQMTLELRDEALRELSLLASAEAEAEAEAGAGCPLARLRRPAEPAPAAARAPPARRRSAVPEPPQHETTTQRAEFVPTQRPRPAEPRKRPKWDWPSIEDEYLIAKRYKNSVAVL